MKDHPVKAWQEGYLEGGEAVQTLVLSMQKGFRHQCGIEGVHIQVEGFIDPVDVRNISCQPPKSPANYCHDHYSEDFRARWARGRGAWDAGYFQGRREAWDEAFAAAISNIDKRRIELSNPDRVTQCMEIVARLNGIKHYAEER